MGGVKGKLTAMALLLFVTLSPALRAEDTPSIPDDSSAPQTSASQPAEDSGTTAPKSQTDLIVQQILDIGKTEAEIVRTRAEILENEIAKPVPTPRPLPPTNAWRLERFVPSHPLPVRLEPVQTN